MDMLKGLYGGQKSVLKELKFLPATKEDKVPVPEGINLILLDGGEPVSAEMPRSVQNLNKAEASSSGRPLFKESDLSFEWNSVKRPGAGLRNLGNTCFLNSVLQCLTHTPPLAEHFMKSRSYGNKQNGFSALRIMQDQIQRAFSSKHAEPRLHVKSMKLVCKSFRHGRQEDAHEYLIALLDMMHENLLEGIRPKPSPSIQATSMIYSIFAGKMRSQVKCTECGYESNTSDPFLDISLEITRAQTLQKALERFTANEYLDGGNKYKCPRHSSFVKAVKRMAIEKAPNVLCIHLKRFEYSLLGQKITKKVDFETSLDLAPFMTDRRSPPVMYELYGVLVHQGFSVHSGHYYAFVKAPNGLWYQMNDDHVSQVSERVALAQKAYILFYIKSQKPVPGGNSNSQPIQSGLSVKRKGPEFLDSQPNGHHKNQPKSLDADASEKKADVKNKQRESPRKRPREEEDLPQNPTEAVTEDQEKQPIGPKTKEEANNKTPEEGKASIKPAENNSAELNLSRQDFRPPGAQGSVRPRQNPGSRMSRRSSSLLANPNSSPTNSFQGRAWVRHQRQIAILKQKKASFGRSPRNTPPSGSPAPKPLPNGVHVSKPQSADFPSQNNTDSLDDLPLISEQQRPDSQLDKKRKLNGTIGPENQTPSDPKVSSKDQEEEAAEKSEIPESTATEGQKSRKKQKHSLEENHLNGSLENGIANGQPDSPRTRQLAAKIRKSTDPNLVNGVLKDAANGEATGPLGEECWDSVPKGETKTFQRSNNKGPKKLDEYDLEYDRGKTKKVKGLGQADTWEASKTKRSPNKFQMSWNVKQQKVYRTSSQPVK